MQKEAINNRTSVNLYIREGMGVPQKIRNAIRPLNASTEKTDDHVDAESPSADHIGMKSKSTYELMKHQRNSG